MGLINIILGNASESDVEALKKTYVPLLCEDEHIERAFSHIRDKWVFTNKRLIMQNTQGVTGKKKEFLSIPYHSVEYYSVETAGTLDEDAELKIWVKGKSQPVIIHFGTKMNVLEVQRLFSEHVL